MGLLGENWGEDLKNLMITKYFFSGLKCGCAFYEPPHLEALLIVGYAKPQLRFIFEANPNWPKSHLVSKNLIFAAFASKKCCFICLEKRVKTFAPMFGVVVCEHNYIILTYCSYTLGWSLFESRILV